MQAGPITGTPSPVVAAPARREEPLIVQLADRADVSDIAAMPNGAAKKVALHARLTGHATESQAALLARATELQHRGLVSSVESLWSPNALVVTPTQGHADAVRAALQVEGVDTIWGSRDARLLWRHGAGAVAAAATDAVPVASPMAAPPIPPHHPTPGGAPDDWNLRMVGARQAQADGARGAGARFGIIDTGVDGAHPELSGTYAGRRPDGTVDHDHAWHDFSERPLAYPHDPDGHGTEVASLSVGRRVGVAPDATWIAARGTREDGHLGNVRALQWMLAPTRLDGSDPRPDLAPDVLGQSWDAGDPAETFFAESMSHFDAAGIFVAKAAGNNGPDGRITSPGQFASVTSVAAVGRDGVVAPFSSAGPSPLPHPPGTAPIAKPDLAAPGVEVDGAWPGGGFERNSGTSMSQPHVAGAALSVRGRHPQLSNAELQDALRTSAREVTGAGARLRYGAGILDVPGALQAAAKLAATHGRA